MRAPTRGIFSRVFGKILTETPRFNRAENSRFPFLKILVLDRVTPQNLVVFFNILP